VATGDQIKDWEGGTSAAPLDHLHFAGLAGVTTVLGTADASNYVEVTAASYDAATALANTFFQGNQVHYVVAQVGTDVVVFADTTNGGGLTAGDDAVVLVGRSLTDIDTTSII